MGVSFKVARLGTRHRRAIPPPLADEMTMTTTAGVYGDEAVVVASAAAPPSTRNAFSEGGGGGGAWGVPTGNCGSSFDSQDLEPSFSLNLFPEGYTIGRASQGVLSSLLQEPKNLHPYDKDSRVLFFGIEHGWLPADVLDDIPCQYLNGTILCELWDFRNCIAFLESLDPSGDGFPRSHKVCLRISMENIVKDIPSITDESWTYNDLLKAEAQITKALQPVLCLDPNPSFDKNCRTQVSKELDLGIYQKRQKGKHQEPVAASFGCHDLSEGREVPTITGFENSRPQMDGDGMTYCHQRATVKSMENVRHGSGKKDVLRRTLPLKSQKNFDSEATSTRSVSKIAVTKPVSISAFNPGPGDSCHARRTNIKLDSISAFNPGPRDSCHAPRSSIQPNSISAFNPGPRGSCHDPRTSVNTLPGKRGRQKAQGTPRPRTKRPKQEAAELVLDQLYTVVRPSLPDYKEQVKDTPLHQQPEVANNRKNTSLNEQHPQSIPNKQTIDMIFNPNVLIKRKIKEEPVEFGTFQKPVLQKIRKNLQKTLPLRVQKCDNPC